MMRINKDSIFTIPGLLFFLLLARSLLKMGLGDDSSVPDFLTIIAAVAPFAITELKDTSGSQPSETNNEAHIISKRWSYKASLTFYMVCVLVLFLVVLICYRAFQGFEGDLISGGHLNVDNKGDAALQIYFAGCSLFLFFIPFLSIVSMKVGYRSEKIYFSLFFIGIVLVFFSYTLSNLIVEIGRGEISSERLMSTIFNISPDVGTQFKYDKAMFVVFQFLAIVSLTISLTVYSWIFAYLGHWLGRRGIIPL